MATRRTTDPGRTPDTTPKTKAAPTRRKPTKATASQGKAAVTEDARRGMIAEAAYLRSERRGFQPGYEDEDWLAAESEVDALLSAGSGAAQ